MDSYANPSDEVCGSYADPLGALVSCPLPPALGMFGFGVSMSVITQPQRDVMI